MHLWPQEEKVDRSRCVASARQKHQQIYLFPCHIQATAKMAARYSIPKLHVAWEPAPCALFARQKLSGFNVKLHRAERTGQWTRVVRAVTNFPIKKNAIHIVRSWLSRNFRLLDDGHLRFHIVKSLKLVMWTNSFQFFCLTEFPLQIHPPVIQTNSFNSTSYPIHFNLKANDFRDAHTAAGGSELLELQTFVRRAVAFAFRPRTPDECRLVTLPSICHCLLSIFPSDSRFHRPFSRFLQRIPPAPVVDYQSIVYSSDSHGILMRPSNLLPFSSD